MGRGADAGVERVRGEAGAEGGDACFDGFDGGRGWDRCGHSSIIFENAGRALCLAWRSLAR